nr:origin of replication complex subunit 1A-like [Ipomoea batatas]
MELLLQMEVPRKPPPQKRATVKPIKPEAVIVISPDTKEEVKEKNSLRRKAAAEDSSRKTYTATLTARSKKTFTSSTRKLRHITYAEEIYKFYKEAEDMMMCGGSDSVIIPTDRDGFVMGDGAGVLLLEELEHAKDHDGFVMGDGAGVLLLEELEHAKKCFGAVNVDGVAAANGDIDDGEEVRSHRKIWHSFKRIADIDDGEEDCEEAESDREWNSAEAFGSDSEDDVEYEEENKHNLLNTRQLPTHPLAGNLKKQKQHFFWQLSPSKIIWKKALKLLNERFLNETERFKEDNRPCILLIDELDLLVTRNQSVAAVSGDARCALEICRRAAELADCRVKKVHFSA